MTIQITLGQIDHATSLLIERFSIPELEPLVPSLTMPALAREAIDEAVTHRHGVLLVAPKGAGKSHAIDAALAQFERDEDYMCEQMPETYHRRNVIKVLGMTARTPREVYLHLLGRTSPGFRDRQYGSRKSDDQLRTELLKSLQHKNFCLLVFDEGEYLVPASLDALRKLLAESTLHDPSRRVTGEDGGTAYMAGGVGIVLVGTPEMERVVHASTEAGNRWARAIRGQLLDDEHVAHVYRAIFPGMRASPDVADFERWRAFIQGHVTIGARWSLHQIEAHARRYYRFVVQHLANTGATEPRREEVPFQRDLFLFTLRESLTRSVDPIIGARRSS